MSKGISTKYPLIKIEAFKNYANTLASEALKEDENLLAFALAAPSVPLAVVQFREKIDIRNITDHTFLGIYWRELGIAWNQTDGAQFWGGKTFRFLFNYRLRKYLLNFSSNENSSVQRLWSNAGKMALAI